MNNLIEFLRMFFSYALTFLVYAAVAGAGIFAGVLWNRKKGASGGKKKQQEQTHGE